MYSRELPKGLSIWYAWNTGRSERFAQARENRICFIPQFGDPDQDCAHGPSAGAIGNDGAEAETGATNREWSSTPGLVSDAVGMLGGGGGDTSFESGNENQIELIDGSRGPTSGRWEEHGGEGKDMVSEYLSSQSSATQNVIPPVDLSFS